MGLFDDVFAAIQRKRGPDVWDEDPANITMREDESRTLSVPPTVDERLINYHPLDVSVPAVEPQSFPTRELAAPPVPDPRRLTDAARNFEAGMRYELAEPPPKPVNVVAPRMLSEPIAAEPSMARMLAAPSPRPPTPALRTLSPAYGEYEDERDRLPAEPDYVKANSVRGKGVGRRILSGFRTAGKTLLASGLNPAAAVVGGVTALADPDAEARYTYRTLVEPRSRARQTEALGRAGKELSMKNVVDDNERQRELLDYNRDKGERQLDLDEREYRLKVESYLHNVRQKAKDAKSDQKREQWKRLIDLVQAHRDFEEPIPAWLADQINAPGLAGATKESPERATPYSVYEGRAIAELRKERNISPGARVPNSEFERRVQMELEAEKGFPESVLRN